MMAEDVIGYKDTFYGVFDPTVDVIVGDTGAGYAGKMLSMAAKKFGLKCKIFMGAKDIKRQKPNCDAMRKNGAEIVPVYTGSQTLVDAVSECMRYWVSNCDTTHMLSLIHI